jgi:diguanylate cyclase (GGDEF)-like protein
MTDDQSGAEVSRFQCRRSGVNADGSKLLTLTSRFLERSARSDSNYCEVPVTEQMLYEEVGRVSAVHHYKLLDTLPEPAFDRIKHLVKTVLSVPICTLSLINSDRQGWKSCVQLNATERSHDICFYTHVMQGQILMNIADAREDPRFSDNPLVTGAPHIRSYLGIPLSSREGYSLGALCVIDTKPRNFGPAQIEVLQDFAELVIHEMELRLMAQTDHLTGLASRRRFILEADKAIAHFVRSQVPAALLVLDVDHFKRINDTYGHRVGDVVLRSIGSQLTSLIRSTDTVGRLGGEEFGVLLPGHSLDEAEAIAERLRITIEETKIKHNPPIRMTASFGVASLTERSLSFDDWVACADQGLYAAKRSGRNRTCTF